MWVGEECCVWWVARRNASIHHIFMRFSSDSDCIEQKGKRKKTLRERKKEKEISAADLSGGVWWSRVDH